MLIVLESFSLLANLVLTVDVVCNYTALVFSLTPSSEPSSGSGFMVKSAERQSAHSYVRVVCISCSIGAESAIVQSRARAR